MKSLLFLLIQASLLFSGYHDPNDSAHDKALNNIIQNYKMVNEIYKMAFHIKCQLSEISLSKTIQEEIKDIELKCEADLNNVAVSKLSGEYFSDTLSVISKTILKTRLLLAESAKLLNHLPDTSEISSLSDQYSECIHALSATEKVIGELCAVIKNIRKQRSARILWINKSIGFLKSASDKLRNYKITTNTFFETTYPEKGSDHKQAYDIFEFNYADRVFRYQYKQATNYNDFPKTRDMVVYMITGKGKHYCLRGDDQAPVSETMVHEKSSNIISNSADMDYINACSNIFSICFADYIKNNLLENDIYFLENSIAFEFRHQDHILKFYFRSKNEFVPYMISLVFPRKEIVLTAHLTFAESGDIHYIKKMCIDNITAPSKSFTWEIAENASFLSL